MSNSWNLTKEKIHQSFSNAVYNRGYVYYLQGRVSDLEYDDRQSIWRGKVSGRNLYHVTVKLYHDFVDTSCDCPAYNRSLECKHGVAVLFAICDDDLQQMHPKHTAINRQSILSIYFALIKIGNKFMFKTQSTCYELNLLVNRTQKALGIYVQVVCCCVWK